MTISVSSQSSEQRILDATERLLGRFGYRKMTVEDIAVEAGIGKGTVYLYFPSKEEVVLSTIDRIVDHACEAMEREARSATSSASAVRAMLRARIVVRLEAVAGYSASLDDLLASIRGSLLVRRARHFDREAAILARAIRRGQRKGELVSGSPRRFARALILATNSFLPYALSLEELRDRKRIIKESNAVIHLVVDGMTEPAIKEKRGEDS